MKAPDAMQGKLCGVEIRRDRSPEHLMADLRRQHADVLMANAAFSQFTPSSYLDATTMTVRERK